MSDDGEHAIVVIALLGSPFSAAYARAQHGNATADPLSFCALNVAVYGPRGAAWSLREREIRDEDRSIDTLRLGQSVVAWQRGRLVIDIDERTTPFGRPLRGRVVVHPEEPGTSRHALDPEARHLWWPVAPLSRVEVSLSEPDLRFSGPGYHDANAGDVPLGATFRTWTWSRARLADRAVITYDVTFRDGRTSSIALGHDRSGVTPIPDRLHRAALPRSTWGLDRTARADPGTRPRIVRSLEDGPFYARALVGLEAFGRRGLAMHETLSADRLDRRWVRFLAGFRTGKAA